MTTEERGPDAHVVFELAVEDGWPPVRSERVWAFHLGGDHYRSDNVPWFVRDLAVGDVVRAHAPDVDSHPVFTDVVERSDHVTIRLICFRRGPMEGDLARALESFTALGVYRRGGLEIRHARPRRVSNGRSCSRGSLRPAELPCAPCGRTAASGR